MGPGVVVGIACVRNKREDNVFTSVCPSTVRGVPLLNCPWSLVPGPFLGEWIFPGPVLGPVLGSGGGLGRGIGRGGGVPQSGHKTGVPMPWTGP